MKRDLKIGIIVADGDEYAPLKKHIESGEHEELSLICRPAHRFNVRKDGKAIPVVSLLCGIGKVNAAAGAMALVLEGCNVILNFGLSGGISGVCRGDIVAVTKYLEHDFDLTGLGYAPCEKPGQKYIYESHKGLLGLAGGLYSGLKTGTAVSGDHFISSKAEQSYLKETFDAVCCDMETAAIAYVCDACDAAFLALRRISDDADDSAADLYREMNESNETVLSDLVLSLAESICCSSEL